MKFLAYWPILAPWVVCCCAQRIEASGWFFTASQNSSLIISTGEWRTVNSTLSDFPRPPWATMQSTIKGQILVTFRGYRFTLHITRPQGAFISVWLDGKPSTFPFVPENQTIQESYSIGDTGLEDMIAMRGEVALADHQLLVDVSASVEHPVIFDKLDVSVVDSIVVPTDLTIAASSLPSGEIVDDVSDLLVYSDFGWERQRHPYFWNNSSSITTTPGSWVRFRFIGTGLWVYGVIPVEGTVFTVEAVRTYGRETARNVTTYNVTRPELDIPIYGAPLIAHPTLAYSNAYDYNITLISGELQVDFFKVAGNMVHLGAGDVQTTDHVGLSRPVRDIKKIIIPVACGLFILLVGFVSFFVYRRRKSRTSALTTSNDDMSQNQEEFKIQPFDSISANPSSNGNRPTKAPLPLPHSTLLLQPPSSSTPSTTNWGDSASTELNAWQSNTGSLDLARLQYHPVLGTEDGEPMSLSHTDLAKVFKRAEELRLDTPRNGDSSGNDGELDPPLEALARQLAARTVLVG